MSVREMKGTFEPKKMGKTGVGLCRDLPTAFFLGGFRR